MHDLVDAKCPTIRIVSRHIPRLNIYLGMAFKCLKNLDHSTYAMICKRWRVGIMCVLGGGGVFMANKTPSVTKKQVLNQELTK